MKKLKELASPSASGTNKCLCPPARLARSRSRLVGARGWAGVDTLVRQSPVRPPLISSVFHLAASKILICTFDDRQSLKCVVARRTNGGGCGREGEGEGDSAAKRRRETSEGCRVGRGGSRMEGGGGRVLNSERVLLQLRLG